MSKRELIKSKIDEIPEISLDEVDEIITIYLATRETINKDDRFWSDENQDYLSKVIRKFENSKKEPIMRTIEELEALGE
ncbi:MAG: hypothetical protein LBM87_05895 [Ruminococcus sp.]|jgi:hypothetical protein|nr:hypothetical protein [Ruminococcus sp.]